MDVIGKNKQCLQELLSWAKKWGAEISGCGCCGSPWVVFSDNDEVYNLHVTPKHLSFTSNGEHMVMEHESELTAGFDCKIGGSE